MGLVSGVNHVAVVTADLDRFVDFYMRVFGLELVFSETTPGLRHAILRTGRDSWLHPAEIPGNAHAEAVPTMFRRGHIDHLSLTAASPSSFAEICGRLAECGARRGDVEDLGAFHSIWFEDPDGMRAELVVIVDPALAKIHAPRPLGRMGAGPTIAPNASGAAR
jgi:catechol 2,3-dioxygenase-like lactoylglutathione lyase family enzyme